MELLLWKMLLLQIDRLRVRRIRPVLEEFGDDRNLVDGLTRGRTLLLIHFSVLFIGRESLDAPEGLAKRRKTCDDVCQEFCRIREFLAWQYF